MKQDEFKKRSDNIELLEKYSNWLMKNGYLDTDWQSEPPYAIDEFLKTLPKNLLSKKPSVSDEEINNKLTEILEDYLSTSTSKTIERIRECFAQIPPQVVQSEVSDDVNIVLDNKHEINYNITPPDAEKWISVEEKPKEDIHCLVFLYNPNTNDSWQETAYTLEGYFHGVMGKQEYITHWMPLPKPPINKQGGK